MNDKDQNKNFKVEWLGIDGGLVALYFILVIFLGYGMVTRSDIILGWIAPIALIAATTVIFLNYLKTVFSFMRDYGKEK